METARPAREGDRAVCAVLLAEALAEARSMRGGSALVGTVTHDELLARWMGEGTSRATLHVGEFHDVVVGLAAATMCVRPRATELSGQIECCFVEAGARGVGV